MFLIRSLLLKHNGKHRRTSERQLGQSLSCECAVCGTSVPVSPPLPLSFSLMHKENSLHCPAGTTRAPHAAMRCFHVHLHTFSAVTSQ